MGISKPKEEKKTEEKKEEEKKEKKVVEKKEKEKALKEIVRIVNTDLDGNKKVLFGLASIKGVGINFAKTVCYFANIDPFRKLNTLTEEEINRIEDVIYNPTKFNIPSYLLNRRKDPESGENLHFVGEDLVVRTKMDIQKEIELKTWRGYRHMYGQPVRGQSTRSHFRKGITVGVVRKKIQVQQQAKK